MCTKILKKESSSRALPLFMMLFSLVFMAQNCGAMDKEKGEGVSILSNTDSSIDTHWPKVSSDLLELIPTTTPKENWDKVRKVLRFFNEPDMYLNIKKREERLKNEGKGDGFEAYQAKLVKEGWEAKEAVLSYLVNLDTKTEDLISIIQQYQRLELYIKRTFGEICIQNQELIGKNATLSREKEEVVEQNRMLQQIISGSLEISKLPACDLKETPVVLGSKNQGLLEESATLSIEKEGSNEKIKELIKYLKEKEEVNGFIEANKLQVLKLRETLAFLKGEVEELLKEKQDFSIQKEKLASGNDALDVTLDEMVLLKNIGLLTEQAKAITMKKENLKINPQIIKKIEDLEDEKEEAAKKNATLESEKKAYVTKVRQLVETNQVLSKTNQDLSKKVSYLVWGGVSCAAIAVFYMIIRRGK